MQALEVLKNKLVGAFISRFSVGDTWDLCLGDYWLVAQDIVSEDEALLNKFLKDNYLNFDNTVDKEHISKCAIIAAAMRREIISVKLDNFYNLEIEFDNNFKLVFSTSTEVVDWQWCLNETGADPYQDYLVACFWKGEIQVNEKQK